MRVRREREMYLTSSVEIENLKGFRLAGPPFRSKGYTDLGINNVETYEVLNLNK